MTDKELLEVEMRLNLIHQETMNNLYRSMLPSHSEMEFIQLGMAIIYGIIPLAVISCAFILGALLK